LNFEWWIGAIMPLILLIWLIWTSIKGERGCILPVVVPMPLITMGDVSQRITDVVRSIVIQVFEVVTPIINVVGIALIILGLLLWFGARQEFLGWRMVATGALMLIFIHIVAPFLLSFI
jgi:hypothetical protein